MSMVRNVQSPVRREEYTDKDGVVRVRKVQSFSCLQEVRVPDEDDPARKVSAVVEERSLTRQEFLAQSDINNIIARYKVTGMLPQLQNQPLFGDFYDIPDYQESLNVVIRAQESFGRLPSDVRTAFDNDPQLFLEFMSAHDKWDDDDKAFAKKYGLLKPEVPKAATLDDVVDTLKAQAKPGPSESPQGS